MTSDTLLSLSELQPISCEISALLASHSRLESHIKVQKCLAPPRDGLGERTSSCREFKCSFQAQVRHLQNLTTYRSKDEPQQISKGKFHLNYVL